MSRVSRNETFYPACTCNLNKVFVLLRNIVKSLIDVPCNNHLHLRTIFVTICTTVQRNNRSKNFRQRRWGSSLPGLRTRDPPLGSHRTSGNFLAHLPQPLHIITAVNILQIIHCVEVTSYSEYGLFQCVHKHKYINQEN